MISTYRYYLFWWCSELNLLHSKASSHWIFHREWSAESFLNLALLLSRIIHKFSLLGLTGYYCELSEILPDVPDCTWELWALHPCLLPADSNQGIALTCGEERKGCDREFEFLGGKRVMGWARRRWVHGLLKAVRQMLLSNCRPITSPKDKAYSPTYIWCLASVAYRKPLQTTFLILVLWKETSFKDCPLQVFPVILSSWDICWRAFLVNFIYC